MSTAANEAEALSYRPPAAGETEGRTADEAGAVRHDTISRR